MVSFARMYNPQHLAQKLGINQLNELQNAMLQLPQQQHAVLLAPTGSGKTLGFLLPMLAQLTTTATLQALVVVPSRELALQIEQVFRQLGTGLKVACLYGGHATRIELNSLQQAPAVAIGTPGRLADVYK
jgi:superfamily II DNA/RNA helicase